MKKLLIIMESMQGGGAEKVLIDLLEAIDRRRYEITLLLVFRTGVLLDRLPSWLEVEYLYKHKPRGLRRFAEHFVRGRDFLYRHDARKKMEGRYFDCIVSYLEGPALKIHNCILNHGRRNVTWNHTNLKQSHWTKFLYKSIADEADDYRNMDNVVFVSEGAKEDFKEMFGIDGTHLKVIPNIVDVAALECKSEAFEVEKRKFTIIAVGRLVEVKRYDRIIECAALLSAHGYDFELWILGSGPLKQKLKEQADRLNLKNVVRFLGFKNNPFPYLKAADLMIMASDTEGYGMAIFEAMALGTPVVSTASTGASSIIGGGEGLLTDFSGGALADAVAMLIDDAKERKEIAINARKKAGAFDKESVMRKIYEILG